MRDVISDLPMDLQEVMETILEQMNQLVECEICLIWLLKEGHFQLAASRGISEPQKLDSLVPILYPHLLKIIAGEKAIIWDSQKPPHIVERDSTAFLQLADVMGDMASFITAPLVYRRRPIGVLVVARRHPAYSGRDEQAVMAFANQVAMTIENTRLYQATRKQLEQMRALYEISMDISSRLEIQQVLNAIVKQAAHLLGAQGSTLAVCEPGTQLARVVALYNVPFEYEELTLRPGASAASQVLITGKPVVINDLRQWSQKHLDSMPPAQQPPYNAILAVPLIWEDKAIGSLTVVDRGSRGPFNENDTRVLSLLANLASTALNNAQLYSQVVQLNQQLERKVEERTRELEQARAELAQKAQELQRFLSMTVFMQEEERARIARDLHDSSNQLLTGTMYEIQAAQQSIQGNRLEAALEKLQTAKALLRQIEEENRRLINDLRPSVLDTYGLVTALKGLTERCEKYCGARCVVHITGTPVRLPERIETTVYRILQESLNNIAVHAQAQNVEIRMDFAETRLQVVVSDDGVGFDLDQAIAKNRMGLIGMRERAQSINGQLRVWSEPGRGTRLSLEVPVTAGALEQVAANPPSLAPAPAPFNVKNAGEPEGPQAELISPPAMAAKGRGSRSSPPQTVSQGAGERDARLAEIARAVEELQEETAMALVRESLAQGMDPMVVLNDGVMAGLKAIGHKFETRYYFLGELLTGAKLAEKCLEIIDPYLPKGKVLKKGKVVIGAVQGDIHSIGYGLVAKQLELAGYEVHPIGINVPSVAFIRKAQEVSADIIALSAFLVTTVPYCQEVIDYLKDMGLRDRFKVIIGGSETNQSLADAIGADGWAKDAMEAVELCNRLLNQSTG